MSDGEPRPFSEHAITRTLVIEQFDDGAGPRYLATIRLAVEGFDGCSAGFSRGGFTTPRDAAWWALAAEMAALTLPPPVNTAAWEPDADAPASAGAG